MAVSPVSRGWSTNAPRSFNRHGKQRCHDSRSPTQNSRQHSSREGDKNVVALPCRRPAIQAASAPQAHAAVPTVPPFQTTSAQHGNPTRRRRPQRGRCAAVPSPQQPAFPQSRSTGIAAKIAAQMVRVVRLLSSGREERHTTPKLVHSKFHSRHSKST